MKKKLKARVLSALISASMVLNCIPAYAIPNIEGTGNQTQSQEIDLDEVNQYEVATSDNASSDGEGGFGLFRMINDRFENANLADGCMYKEIGPGKAQLYDVSGASGSLVVPSNVVSNVTGEEYEIVSIYGGIFEGNEDITSLKIEAEITELDAGMFEGCVNLESIILPSTIQSIGESAFEGCESLMSITIPSGVTEIAESTFAGCTSLDSVIILDDENSDKDNITKIGASAFERCESLMSFDIPDDVKVLEESAFAGCTSLTTVNLGASTSTIGSKAFYECENLVSINLGKQTESGENETVVTKVGVTEVGAYAFYKCENLVGSDTISSDTEAVNLTGIDLSNAVTIGQYAFYECGSIPVIKLGDNLESIGDYAFYNCHGLLEAYEEHCKEEGHDYTYENRHNYDINYCFEESKCCAPYRLYIGKAVYEIGVMALYLEPATYDDKINFISALINTEISDYTQMDLIEESYSIIGAEPSINLVYYDEMEDVRYAYWYAYQYIPVDDELIYEGDGWKGYFERIDWDESEDGVLGEVYLKYIKYSNSDNSRNSEVLSIPEWICTDSNAEMIYLVSGISEDFYKKSVEKSVGDWYWTEIEIPATVCWIENRAFEGCTEIEKINILDDLDPTSSLDIEEYLPSSFYIYESAFKDCSNLKEITLPQYLEGIYANAFENCNNLESVVFTGYNSYLSIGDSVFKNCSSLNNVSLLAGMTLIGNNAFENCTGLRYFYTQSSSRRLHIGKEAFKGCKNLSEVQLAPYTDIGERAFEGCIRLSYVYLMGANEESLRNSSRYSEGMYDNTMTIGDYAFLGCKSLFSFIPDSSIETVHLGVGAFEDCSNLEIVQLPAGTTEIPECVFKNCTKLPSIMLGANVYGGYVSSELQVIGANAFENCSSFSGIVYNYYGTYVGGNYYYDNSYGYYDYDLNYGLLILPDSIRNIGERAFYGCEGITNIEWNLYVVDGENEIGNELFANCAELIDVMFNSEPKFVPGMFKGCKKLKGMKELSPTRSGSDPIEVEPLESIFEDCKKLTFNGTNDYCPIIMPDDTTVIGARAYKNCLNFADEWEIPSNITSIGKEAFFGCNKLKTVYAIDSNLEFVGANAFNGDVAFVTNDSNIQLLLIAGLNQEEHAYTTWNGIDDVEPGAIVHLDGTSIEGTVTIGRNAQVFIPEDVDVELKGTIILERDASITLEERSTLTLIGTLSGPSDSAYRSSLILKGTLEGNGSIGSRIDVYTVLTDDMVTMSGISEGLPFTGEEIVDVVPVVKFDYFSEEYSVYDPDTETGDYICTYKNNIKAGTASVVITPAENGRLLGGSVSKTFKIVKGTIDGFIWEVDDDTTDADVTVKVGVTKAGPVDGGRSSIKITLTDEETKSSLVKTVFLEDSSEKDVSVLAEWKNVYNGTYTVTLEYSGDANHEPAQYTVESPIEVTGYVRPSYNGSTNNGGSTSGGGSNGGSTSGGGGSTGGGGGTSGGGGGGSSATPPANPKTDTKDYGTVNYDPIKGMVSSNYGIVTSKLDKNLCEWVYDGASALIWGGNADTYWKLMYIDGSYAKGSKAVDANGNTYENYHWEFIDGKWWTFDSNGFAKIGWLYDENYKGWFYIDVNRGMKTGWICVDGKWYYLEPKRGSNEGMMYAAQWTPDGYYVNADGAWDGRPAMQIAQ